MIRITGGRYCGLRLPSVSGRTRPTSGRARESLFNILGDISGLTFADLYAGSGAVGIEALSRGAEFVEFVESDRKTSGEILENIRRLDIESSSVRVRPMRVESWIAKSEMKFDIIFADPPFIQTFADYFTTVLPKLKSKLTENGILILQTSDKIEICDSWTDKRTFGDEALYFWEKALDD
ncbi:MAG: 16S rRNA (guanine(966)-N(2))-methyltransferase RsmD [bacterium]